ncbi:glycosyltransferase family 87 protein [Komagataeibacter kakiaceti]|uniref:glycosyltransferase family 87 protein n=1 Tax=Komagataeibacter kakiaceti TaxID=943261 RepID=UPI000AFD0111|nr:glycosyltransferase family 87 protein [Komagataeibacter kakiaceti]
MTRQAVLFILLSLISINIYNAFPVGIHHPLFHVDFEKAYYAAGAAVLRGGPQALWPLIEQAEFVNWPIESYLFLPFAWSGLEMAEHIFLLLGILATTGSFILLAEGCNLKTKSLLALLFLANGPLWYSLVAMGNTTHFILFALICVLLFIQRRRMYAAGILIGMAAAIKPMISIFILYFFYRRNYRAALSGMTVITTMAISSIIFFGQSITYGWYEHCIVEFSTKPIGAFNNQSLSAFLLRLQTGPAYLYDWHGQDVLGNNHILVKNIPLLLLLFTGYVGWKWRKEFMATPDPDPYAADIFDFSLLITFCIVTSPVSWTHYYLLLLLPWSFYITGRLPRNNDPMTSLLVWSSIVLASMPVIYPTHLPEPIAAWAARSLASLWFLGGMLFLFSLLRYGLSISQAVQPSGLLDMPSLIGDDEGVTLGMSANDDLLPPAIMDRTTGPSP